jgi:pimeloyl-ACP methyl ester carboxylesterase
MRRLLVGLLAILAIAAGAFFGIADFDVPLEELKLKYGQEPSQFMVLPSGMEAHYRDQGNPNGQVLVLVHGSNASLYTWEPWVAELGGDFRILTVDLPGHGLSSLSPGHDYSSQMYTTFLKQFTEALSLDHFILAGNSMGGWISWRYTLEHPEQIDALVLLDASGIPLENDQEEGALYKIAKTPVLNKILLYVMPNSMVADSLRDAIADDDLVTQVMVDRYHDFLIREGRRAATLERTITPREPFDIERLAEITAPTLILWGELDTLVPVEAAYVFDAKIPNSTLIVYPDIGHLPMEEVPGESAEALRAFLSLH